VNPALSIINAVFAMSGSWWVTVVISCISGLLFTLPVQRQQYKKAEDGSYSIRPAANPKLDEISSKIDALVEGFAELTARKKEWKSEVDSLAFQEVLTAPRGYEKMKHEKRLLHAL
jgi:hypothetical protein